MARNPKIPATPKPVTGVFRPRNPMANQDHHVGWDKALDAALEGIGRSRGDYQVHIEFSAVVNVKNPGNIIEYQVTII
jgi:hypothetical protein